MFHSLPLSPNPNDRIHLWRWWWQACTAHWSVLSDGNSLTRWIIISQYHDTCHVSGSPGHRDKSQPILHPASYCYCHPSLSLVSPLSSIWSQLRLVYFYFIWFTIRHSCWHNGHSGILNHKRIKRKINLKFQRPDFGSWNNIIRTKTYRIFWLDCWSALGCGLLSVRGSFLLLWKNIYIS